MINVFISIPPPTQTTIKPQKLLNNAAVWSGQGAVPPPPENFGILFLEMLNFGAF